MKESPEIKQKVMILNIAFMGIFYFLILCENAKLLALSHCLRRSGVLHVSGELWEREFALTVFKFLIIQDPWPLCT